MVHESLTEEEYHAIFNNNDELYAYASKYGNNNWKYRSSYQLEQ